MTVLAPMSAAAFAGYAEHAIAEYARDNVAAGRWPAESALARSRAEFESQLPQGVETPDNHFYEIKESETGPTVGSLWFAMQVSHGVRSAFVYDLEVKPEFRRRGHARAAFEAMEPLARELGASSIGLHVFGHNPGAQALYGQLGYRVTGVNMLKDLSGGDRS